MCSTSFGPIYFIPPFALDEATYLDSFLLFLFAEGFAPSIPMPYPPGESAFVDDFLLF